MAAAGFLTLLLAAALSFAGCLVMIRLAGRLHLLAQPLGPQKSAHQVPTAVGGGLAVFAVCYLLLAVHFALGMTFEQPLLLLAPAVVAATGLLDDQWQLPAGQRLLVHFVCGIWLLGLLHPLSGADFWGWVSLAVQLLAFVWMVNLMNFMDGSDGLAAGQAVFVLTGLVLLDEKTTWLALPAIGALAGFLLLNLPPARIFLGDTGSGFLGAFIAMLLLSSIAGGRLSPGAGLVLIAPFAMDATWTLIRRALRGKNLTLGHREHAYQKVADSFGAARLLAGTQLINWLWLLPLAFAAEFAAGRLAGADIWVAVAAYLPLLALCLGFRGGQAVESSAAKE